MEPYQSSAEERREQNISQPSHLYSEMENNPVNKHQSEVQKRTNCQFCSKPLRQGQLTAHYKHCQMKLIACPKCRVQVARKALDSHLNECYDQSDKEQCDECGQEYIKLFQLRHDLQCSKGLIESINEMHKNVNFLDETKRPLGMCIWCRQKNQPQGHEKECHHFKQVEQKINQVTQVSSLTNLHTRVLKYMNKKAAYIHCLSEFTLKKSIKRLGLTPHDLSRMRNYLSEVVPINIHFKLNLALPGFIKDGYYRNTFEVQNKPQGVASNRQVWQNYLFDNHYNQAQPVQRVKYGALNIGMDNRGIRSCRIYGSAFIVLQNHVKDRCTFSSERSYQLGEKVSTFNYPNLVLSLFSDKQLLALKDAAQENYGAWREIHSFKEVQIHGPISFAKDVKCIYARAVQIGQNQQLVNQFEIKFGVPIIPLGM